MALSYSLKYQKQNFFYKVLLEKEGEIILDRNFLRLKGKGAKDQGEIVYFAEIKELKVQNDRLTFTTFKKERFTLSKFLNMFDPFLKDFFRVRNEYLAEALFMKVGMLYQEYSGYVEVINRSGSQFNKGKCRIQFYEGSIVFMPENQDAFTIAFNFLKNHEFDEDEYVLKMHMDTGSTVRISQLGTQTEDLLETLETLLGKMYEKVIAYLREFFPELDPGALLKLAYLIRNGKCIPIAPLKKIHEDLPKKFEELALSLMQPKALEKFTLLRATYPDATLYTAFSFVSKPETRDIQIKTALVLAVPQENFLIFFIPSNNFDQYFYFFRVIMENGDITERLQDKMLEISQYLFTFHFDTTPLIKNTWEIRKTKYYAAFRKLVFLRLLRKSMVGRVSASLESEHFQAQVEKSSKMAKLAMKTILKVSSNGQKK